MALLASANTLTRDHFVEHPCPPQPIKQFFWQWEWIPILDHFLVQPTVVNAKPKALILLGYEQDWGAIGRIQWSDEAMVEHALNLLLCLFQLKGAMDQGHVILELNLELMPLVHWRKSKWKVLRKDIVKFLKDCTNMGR